MNNYPQALRLFPSFPCALVTVDENIITVAMVHIFSFAPPLLGVGIAPRRYSYSLLKKTKDFVVNIPTEDLLQKVELCGKKSGRDVNKFQEAGLTKEPSAKTKSVTIKDCPVNIECVVRQEIETGDHTWFIGEVVHCQKDINYNKDKTLLYWGGKYRLPGPIVFERY